MDKYKIKKLIGNKPNPILMEIGCADGKDTQEFINIFNDTNFKMYCFEPDQRNVRKFKEDIRDNRVVLYEYVVGDVNGLVDFYKSTKSSSGEELIYSSSLREPGEKLFEIWKQFEGKFIKVQSQSITLDYFVNAKDISYIDFVWLDVQGCEDMVIKGGINTFKDKVQYLYTEYSNQEIYKGEPNLFEILKMLPNYSIIEIFSNLTGDREGGDILLKNNSL